MPLHVAANVFFQDIQGAVVILQLRTESYYILDRVGTAMWHCLLTTDDEQTALQSLHSRYAVAASRLAADLQTFRHRCLKEGFLQEEAPAATVVTPCRGAADRPRLLPLMAWWSLFRTTRSLSARGLAKTYTQYARLAVAPDPDPGALDLLARCVSAFAGVENFYLIKRAPQDCLPRSLALFRFLRSVGLPVEHCIGVQRFPFHAHAWVEFQGRVVHDSPFRPDLYTTLARIAA